MGSKPSKFDDIVCEYKERIFIVEIKECNELGKSEVSPAWIEMSETGSWGGGGGCITTGLTVWTEVSVTWRGRAFPKHIPSEMAIVGWNLSVDQYSICVPMRSTRLVRYDVVRCEHKEWYWVVEIREFNERRKLDDLPVRRKMSKAGSGERGDNHSTYHVDGGICHMERKSVFKIPHMSRWSPIEIDGIEGS